MKKFVGLIIWKHQQTTGMLINANHIGIAQIKQDKYINEQYGGYDPEIMEDYFVIDEKNMVEL